MKRIPVTIFKCITGGLGFCIGFLLIYLPTTLFPINFGSKYAKILFSSKHLFVEILSNETSIHEAPSMESTVLRTLPKGVPLLLSDVREHNNLMWNKVLVGRGKYGWVVRIIPAQIGVPEKRVSIANKFYFRIKDIYNLFLGVLGFIWGFWRFKIKPT